LQIGDELRTATWETGTVEAIHFTVAPQPMYNFTVATAHTYFVGNGQWLVHNACGRQNIEKAIRSLEHNIAEHEKKLADYIANPDAFDNRGFLQNAPNEEIRQSIIQGRINHLQNEINTWRQRIIELKMQLNE